MAWVEFYYLSIFPFFSHHNTDARIKSRKHTVSKVCMLSDIWDVTLIRSNWYSYTLRRVLSMIHHDGHWKIIRKEEKLRGSDWVEYISTREKFTVSLHIKILFYCIFNWHRIAQIYGAQCDVKFCKHYIISKTC